MIQVGTYYVCRVCGYTTADIACADVHEDQNQHPVAEIEALDGVMPEWVGEEETRQ